MGPVLECGRFWDPVSSWVRVDQRGTVRVVVAVEGVAFGAILEEVI